MTRYRKTSPQGQQEEAKKALKQSKESQASGRNKANPSIQRLKSGDADANTILDLQQTIGNQAVGRLLTGPPPTVQREAIHSAAGRSEDDLMTGGPSTVKLGPTPGAPPSTPMPFPNQAAPSSALASQTNIKSKGPITSKSSFKTSKGDEAGTAGGVKSMSTLGTAANKPLGSHVKPSQSIVKIDAGSPAQQEESSQQPPAAASHSQSLEEETGS